MYIGRLLVWGKIISIPTIQYGVAECFDTVDKIPIPRQAYVALRVGSVETGRSGGLTRRSLED